MPETTDSIILKADDTVPAPFARVFAHWLETRGDAWAPSLKQFRLEDLDGRILPWSILADVEAGGKDVRFRFWGSQRTGLIGREMTGMMLSDVPDTYMREGNRREYLKILEIKRPLLCNTPVTTTSGRELVFQSIRLPISDDGETVTHVYSAINYEQISRAHYEYYGTQK